MKTTDNFKKTIQNHLEQLAKEDELFAKTLKKENKNIDDCITYILNVVQKSGCNGFTDSEIYNLAIHYYDEDNIDIGTIRSVKELYETSTKLKHCAFTNEYHKEKNSLLLVAYVDSVLTETIEVKLNQLVINQARGIENKASKYNKKIIRLVNTNMHLIENILTAIKSA